MCLVIPVLISWLLLCIHFSHERVPGVALLSKIGIASTVKMAFDKRKKEELHKGVQSAVISIFFSHFYGQNCAQSSRVLRIFDTFALRDLAGLICNLPGDELNTLGEMKQRLNLYTKKTKKPTI